MLTALDLYIASLPVAGLLTYGTLGALALGLTPLAVGVTVLHVRAVRVGR